MYVGSKKCYQASLELELLCAVFVDHYQTNYASMYMHVKLSFAKIRVRRGIRTCSENNRKETQETRKELTTCCRQKDTKQTVVAKKKYMQLL